MQCTSVLDHHHLGLCSAPLLAPQSWVDRTAGVSLCSAISCWCLVTRAMQCSESCAHACSGKVEGRDFAGEWGGFEKQKLDVPCLEMLNFPSTRAPEATSCTARGSEYTKRSGTQKTHYHTLTSCSPAVARPQVRVDRWLDLGALDRVDFVSDLRLH